MRQRLALTRTILAVVAVVAAAAGCGVEKGAEVAPVQRGLRIQNSTTSGQAPLEVSFQAVVEGPWSPARYLWRIDDGSSITEAATPSLRYTFRLPGAYTVGLTAYDSAGTPVEATPVAVSVGPPPDLTVWIRTRVRSQLEVAFEAVAQGGIPPYEYVWDFGDGQGSTDANPAHLYDAEGSYEVGLEVTDAQGTRVATAVLLVTLSDPGNPVAVDDHAETAEDTEVLIDVLANDLHTKGLPLELTSVETAAMGVVEEVSDGRVRYTPNPDFNGSDQFGYEVTDPAGTIDGAVVTVVVAPVNDPPSAREDTVELLEDGSATVPVLANDEDPDGDTLRVQSVTRPGHGTVGLDPTTQTVMYRPDPDYAGSDRFTYEASDGNGETDQATVDLIVLQVNDAPLITNGQALALQPDPAVLGEAMSLNLLPETRDVEGDPVTVEAVWAGAPIRGGESWTEVASGQVGASVPVLSAEEVSPHWSYQLRLTPSDGATAGDAVITPAVAVANSPPTIEAALTLSPAAPTSAESLGLAEPPVTHDDDGDSVRFDVTWQEQAPAGDWVDLAEHTTADASTVPQLPAEATRRGYTYRVRVVPDDSWAEGAAVVSNSALIVNAPPVVANSPVIEPPTPVTTQMLGLSEAPVGADADEGDPVTLDLRWQVSADGPDEGFEDIVGEAGGALTLAAGETTRDHWYRLVVTPSDPFVNGAAYATPAVGVANSPPELLNAATLTLTPSVPDTDDELMLSAAVETGDADEDTVTVTYRWESSGTGDADDFVAIDGRELAALPSVATSKNTWYRVCIQLGDQAATSETCLAALRVVNTPPALTNSPVIDPATPRTLELLSLDPTPTAEDADPEDDPPTIEVSWEVSTTGALEDYQPMDILTATLVSSKTTKHEWYRACMTPTDGEEAGETVCTVGVEVLNSPPRIANSPVIEPDTAVTTDDLMLDAAPQVSDDDQDTPLSVRYQWEWATTDDGEAYAIYQDRAEAQLDAGDTVKNTYYRLCIYASDSEEEGEGYCTPGRFVDNSTPVISNADTLGLTPTAPITTEPLGLDAAVETEDVDPDDSVEVEAQWQVSTEGPGSGFTDITDATEMTLSSTDTEKHRWYRVCLTPTDQQSFGETSCMPAVEVLNAPPDAADDEAEVEEDGEAILISVLTNDGDADGDALVITAAGTPSLGAVDISDDLQTLEYTPAPDANGIDTFSVTVGDPDGGEDTATVTVDIDPVPDILSVDCTWNGGWSCDALAPRVGEVFCLAVETDAAEGEADTLAFALDGQPTSGPCMRSWRLGVDITVTAEDGNGDVSEPVSTGVLLRREGHEGQIVLLGLASYTALSGRDSLLGNAVLTANTANPTLTVLGYTEHADTAAPATQMGVAQVDQAIASRAGAVGRAATIDHAASADELRASLPDYHVLLIYDQRPVDGDEGVSEAGLRSIGESLAGDLQRFIGDGGVIVVTDNRDGSGGTYALLEGAGLMDVTGVTQVNSTGTLTVDEGDPVGTAVGSPAAGAGPHVAFDVVDGTVVATPFMGPGLPLVVHRRFAPAGRVVYLGHDFTVREANADRILVNAVLAAETPLPPAVLVYDLDAAATPLAQTLAALDEGVQALGRSLDGVTLVTELAGSLEDALPEHDVVVFPASSLSVSQLRLAIRPLADDLRNFVAGGGVLVILDNDKTRAVLHETGFIVFTLDDNLFSATNDSLSVGLGFDLVAEDVVDYTAPLSSFFQEQLDAEAPIRDLSAEVDPGVFAERDVVITGRRPDCLRVESFELAQWPVGDWVAVGTSTGQVTDAMVDPDQAVEGRFGLSDPSWHYRTDLPWTETPFRSASLWFRVPDSGDGAVHLGVDGGAGGAASFGVTMGADEGLGAYDSPGYTVGSPIKTTSLDLSAGAWYRLTVEFNGISESSFGWLASVHDSAGQEVASLVSDFTGAYDGGLAIMASGGVIVDDVLLCR